MKVIVLYHPNSEQQGIIEDLARDYKRFKRKTLELISLETQSGADYARLYDITQYPAFLAIADNGTMQRMWQGNPMPLMDELDYYTKDQDPMSLAGDASHRLKVVQPLTLAPATAVI